MTTRQESIRMIIDEYNISRFSSIVDMDINEYCKHYGKGCMCIGILGDHENIFSRAFRCIGVCKRERMIIFATRHGSALRIFRISYGNLSILGRNTDHFF